MYNVYAVYDKGKLATHIIQVEGESPERPLRLSELPPALCGERVLTAPRRGVLYGGYRPMDDSMCRECLRVEAERGGEK